MTAVSDARDAVIGEPQPSDRETYAVTPPGLDTAAFRRWAEDKATDAGWTRLEWHYEADGRGGEMGKLTGVRPLRVNVSLADAVAYVRDLPPPPPHVQKVLDQNRTLREARRSVPAREDGHREDAGAADGADRMTTKDWPGELSDRAHRNVGNSRPANAETIERLQRELDEARLRADAAERELHRITCGVPIESDGLCRYGIGEALALAEVARLREVADAARQIRQWPGDCEYMEALSAALDALDEAEAGSE
jgi:hypothetical protein